MKIPPWIKDPLMEINKYFGEQFHSKYTRSFDYDLLTSRYVFNKVIIHFIHRYYPDKFRLIPISKDNSLYTVFKSGIWSVDLGYYLIPINNLNLMIIHVSNDSATTDKGHRRCYRYVTFHFYVIDHSFWNRKISTKIVELVDQYRKETKRDDRIIVKTINKPQIALDEETTISSVDIKNVVYKGKDKLISDIDRFFSSKDFYHNYGIPYKLGILLYGPPGTGKTTLIRAIASYFKKGITQVSMRTIEAISSNWNSIYAIEEIDLEIQATNKETDAYVVDPIKLKRLIHAIDNIAEGSILFMTTNHIERIPEQILRDGRSDIKLEFKNFTRTEAKEMEDLFDVHVDDLSSVFEDIDNINPSALQNYLRLLRLKSLYN